MLCYKPPCGENRYEIRPVLAQVTSPGVLGESNSPVKGARRMYNHGRFYAAGQVQYLKRALASEFLLPHRSLEAPLPAFIGATASHPQLSTTDVLNQ